jgi:hypothetical protein
MKQTVDSSHLSDERTTKRKIEKQAAATGRKRILSLLRRKTTTK